MKSPLRLAVLCLLCAVAPSAPAAEPWSTYRGTPQRTGNTDGKPGPEAAPKVVWMVRSQDHFVASPVPFGDRVYVSGLGAFNVSTFSSFPAEPKANPPLAVWSKTTPYLKLPTVSSPAVADGKLVFGDGMHQTDGAVLHCLRIDGGLPLWQLPVPGKLVHLEGSPTVVGTRVYLGGGAAGVLCVDFEKLTLDGKEVTPAEVERTIAAKRQELQAKYEEAKRKGDEFAIPPGDDQLPKAAPKRLWQQGQDKWHVDAPVAVVGENVLVASAYLDKEQVGDRALYCLDAATGAVRWRKPLAINPWGGPSILDDLVVVAGSSVGYDTKALKGAKGEIAAFDLKTGTPKWRKDVPGGIIGSVALVKGVAVATATDGKVRAFDLSTGERRWIYDAKAPCFAPPAVAGTVVYAGDLRGVVHAIGLGDGKAKWAFDLASDPAVKLPGMIYGGPAVHGGRLFVATCNLEGASARQPTVLICLGSK